MCASVFLFSFRILIYFICNISEHIFAIISYQFFYSVKKLNLAEDKTQRIILKLYPEKGSVFLTFIIHIMKLGRNDGKKVIRNIAIKMIEYYKEEEKLSCKLKFPDFSLIVHFLFQFFPGVKSSGISLTTWREVLL